MFPEPITIKINPSSSRCVRGVSMDNYDLFLQAISTLCPAILVANKQIHHEATPLLYSMNRFRVGAGEYSYTYETSREILQKFLDHIGNQNASFLRQICIAFPAFNIYHAGNITLQEDSVLSLELLRDRCTNLHILETSLETTTAVEHSIDSLDNPLAATEAMALVNTRFKALPSLKEVIVNVSDKAPNVLLREEMRSCGWRIEVTASKSDRSHDSYDDTDDGYDGYDYYFYDNWRERRDEEDWWDDFDRRQND